MGLVKDLMSWQYYVHILFITTGLVVFLHLLGVHTFHTEMFLPNLNFVYLFFAILVIDIVVHTLFTFAPKPLRWTG